MGNRVPILLYIDNEEQGEIASISLNVEPDVGVVLSVTRTKTGGDGVPQPDKDRSFQSVGAVPDISFSDAERQRMEAQRIREKIEAELSTPSASGYIPPPDILNDEQPFSTADMVLLQKESMLRLHPRFFSDLPPVRASAEQPNVFSSPVEAYPPLVPDEDAPVYELNSTMFSEEDFGFVDVDLTTSDPVFFLSGVETEEQIRLVGKAESDLITKFPNAVGFQELSRPFFFFDEKYDPQTCTLHSHIRVWLPKTDD